MWILHCVTVWDDIVVPIQFKLSPKSLSSAETLPYHTGFPGDRKDENYEEVKFDRWKLPIPGVFAVHKIVLTNCEPRFHLHPISFIFGICKTTCRNIPLDACLQSLIFWSNARFKAGLTSYSGWATGQRVEVEMDRSELTFDQWSMTLTIAIDHYHRSLIISFKWVREHECPRLTLTVG